MWTAWRRPIIYFGLAVPLVSLVAHLGIAQLSGQRSNNAIDESRKELQPSAITKLGRAATAYVEVTLPRRGLASGSAFCVHPDGLFVTNHHVVKDAGPDIRLVLNAGSPKQQILTATVLRSEEREDLALLKVDGATELPVLELGSTTDLAELQRLVAFGFPFGRRLSRTQKFPSISVNSLSISSLRHNEGVLHRIQLDGSLSPGTSGGPVLDRTGRVVGVVVSGIVGSGLAEAIPVSTLRTFLSTPTVTITYPTLGIKDQGKPARFQARVARVMPVGKIDVELIVRAGSHKRTASMTGSGETFSAEVVALPAAPDRSTYAATVIMDKAILPTQLTSRKFKVGSKTIDLGDVQEINLDGSGEVVLSDGRRLPGPVRDLGSVTCEIAGQKLTIELARATKLVSSPSAPSLTGDRVEVALPSAMDSVCVGGNGRYILLRLPRERKLAVFDASVARVVKYLPLAEDNALVAAGQNKLFVALPNSNAIQRWDLSTFQKEVTAALVPPKAGAVQHLLLGSAAQGPLLVAAGGRNNFEVSSYFLDTVTLKQLEI